MPPRRRIEAINDVCFKELGEVLSKHEAGIAAIRAALIQTTTLIMSRSYYDEKWNWKQYEQDVLKAIKVVQKKKGRAEAEDDAANGAGGFLDLHDLALALSATDSE